MPITKDKIPVLVLSLDNVVIKGESLSKLVSYLKQYGLTHGRLGLVKRMYSLTFRRNSEEISQRRLKFELIRSLRNLKKDPAKRDKMAANFALKLSSGLKNKTKALIEEYHNKGGKVALVTSSPAEYALELGKIIGADHCIATPSFSDFRRLYPRDPIDYEECMGTEKSERLLKWLEEINGVPETVVSGEPDDLPLLLLPDIENRFLMSPTKHMRRALKYHDIFYEIK